MCATLAFSQIIGSICVIVARATAPNSVGPGTVFPDAAKWDFSQGLAGQLFYRSPNIVILTFVCCSRESNGFASVLDRLVQPAHNRGRLLLVLPQRTIVYVIP